MILGMTGSREGMTEAAKAKFLEWLTSFVHENGVTEAHHGDCIGADAAFHNIMVSCGVSVVIHPPTDSKARAFCEAEVIKPTKPYLERNRDIVDACDTLVAFPVGPEVMRSGTWATVRYARKIGTPVVIF